MPSHAALQQAAHAAALSLFRKINREGPTALTSAEQRVVGWAIRVLECQPPTASSSSDTQDPGPGPSDHDC